MLASIICPTNRPGGFDVLFSSLRAQTDQEFELLIVDEIRPFRRSATQQVGRGTWHIAPGAPMRWGNYCRSLNRGLDYSRADVLIFISDYTFLSPTCVADHKKFHETHGPKGVALGPIEYTALPPLHPDFPRKYGWSAIGHDPANYSDETYAPWLDFKRRHELYEEWREAYERDLDSGLLDPFMVSTFAEPFTGLGGHTMPCPQGCKPGDREPGCPYNCDDGFETTTPGLKVYETQTRQPPSQFLNLKNDSMRRELLKDFRFDERADGTHGHQDSITHRQLAKLGATFTPGGGAVKICDPHSVAIIRRKGLNDEANLKLAEAEQ